MWKPFLNRGKWQNRHRGRRSSTRGYRVRVPVLFYFWFISLEQIRTPTPITSESIQSQILYRLSMWPPERVLIWPKNHTGVENTIMGPSKKINKSINKHCVRQTAPKVISWIYNLSWKFTNKNLPLGFRVNKLKREQLWLNIFIQTADHGKESAHHGRQPTHQVTHTGLKKRRRSFANYYIKTKKRLVVRFVKDLRSQQNWKWRNHMWINTAAMTDDWWWAVSPQRRARNWLDSGANTSRLSAYRILRLADTTRLSVIISSTLQDPPRTSERARATPRNPTNTLGRPANRSSSLQEQDVMNLRTWPSS